jgi:subtilase family serine protease
MLQKAVPVWACKFQAFLWLFIFVLVAGPTTAWGQSTLRNRITQQVNANVTALLPGSISPLARPAFDTGRADASTRLTGMTIYFKPSVAQQSTLETLLQQQQTPGSQLFHKWLTPAQYGSQFGLSGSDLLKVEAWLEQQGFSIDRVANSHNAISFSGTVAQAETAFQTQIHHYSIRGVTHIANAEPLSIPSAFVGVVLAVRNVSDFRPRPLHRLRRSAVSPQYTYTSGENRFHFLAPGDFATIYDLNTLYSAGYTGSGETIVITGQSAIETSDITNFQSAAGLTQKTPTITLVPGTGTSALEDQYGDEDESDLDLEWSGAVAKGATINFVYVGNNQNYSVFDAIQYAIDNDLGSIVSTSYGACEVDFSNSDVNTLQSWFEEANAQGQTIVAASGDNGATDCEIDSGKGTTVVNGDEATQGLAVDLPAASPLVTGIGGTEFSADVSSPGTYWNSTNSTGDTSAIQYIPEKVWNDTSINIGIQAGGGGKSTIFGKPSWQAGTGVPSDGARDVPDLSLNASPNHDGYLFCASGSDEDPTSCSNGFLDSGGEPDVAGGTSFGAPIFSGILAILSQKLGSTGLGNINPEIYSLAASDYSSVFHDTTSGNNEIPCEIGSTDCTTSPIGYSATTGYDLASGWGSIDAANFVNAFTISTSTSSIATTTTLTASNIAPIVNTTVTLTATVASDSGNTVPQGTVQFVIDGADAGSAVTLSNGVATYSYTPTSAGSHAILANYTPSNSMVNSASSSKLIVTISASTSGNKSFSLSATDVSVAPGSGGTSTIVLTPSDGFTGAVALSVSAPSSLTNACFTYANPSVSASGTVTNGSITISTSESACASTGSKRVSTVAVNSGSAGGGKAEGITLTRAMSGVTFASLLLLGLPGLRRRRWPLLCAILFLASFTLALSGCGSSPGGSPTAPAGIYTLTLTGTNSPLNLSATTTFTLTVN